MRRLRFLLPFFSSSASFPKASGYSHYQWNGEYRMKRRICWSGVLPWSTITTTTVVVCQQIAKTVAVTIAELKTRQQQQKLTKSNSDDSFYFHLKRVFNSQHVGAVIITKDRLAGRPTERQKRQQQLLERQYDNSWRQQQQQQQIAVQFQFTSV